MTEALKEAAARKSVEYIESGMIVGLGTGSTAAYAVRTIAEMLRNGELKDILGVPTSFGVERAASGMGIPLTNLSDHPLVDITIDGADEVDPELNLIKGGGGALLREKIVAQVSKREIIVVDESKQAARLGSEFALPVEVLPFGWAPEAAFLQSLGATVKLRESDDEKPYVTDQGNWILDASFGPIEDAPLLSDRLDRRAGIIAHGLFIGLATDVIVAGADGVHHLTRA